MPKQILLAFTQRFNGRTRWGISSPRLRSGISFRGVTDAFHQAAPSLGILRKLHVFITAFDS